MLGPSDDVHVATSNVLKCTRLESRKIVCNLIIAIWIHRNKKTTRTFKNISDSHVFIMRQYSKSWTHRRCIEQRIRYKAMDVWERFIMIDSEFYYATFSMSERKKRDV